MHRPLAAACLPLVTVASLAISTAPGDARTVKTVDYSFSYTYPTAVARFPALKRWLEADAAHRQASIARDAAADRSSAKRSGYPFHPFESTAEWKVVTETPRLLSLSAEYYAFTGGAHGSTVSAGLVWDKATQRHLAPLELFDPASLDAAIRPAYCARLKAERDRRVGGQVDTGSDLFARCPPFKNLKLLVGSTSGRRIDRIGLIADQYVAGSYAEGIYEVTLPVTPAVLAAVRPAWRSAFALGGPAR